MSAAVLDPAAELERAVSDYLAVSRHSDLYATHADYETAERRAWERRQAAREALEGLGAPQEASQG